MFLGSLCFQRAFIENPFISFLVLNTKLYKNVFIRYEVWKKRKTMNLFPGILQAVLETFHNVTRCAAAVDLNLRVMAGIFYSLELTFIM